MKINDISLPVAEPMLKIAQRVSLKPEAIRETKAGESDRGESEDLLQASRRQMKSLQLFDYTRYMHAPHYAICIS